MINILLVERQLLFRDAMQAIINEEHNLVVIGQAKTGQEAVDQVDALKPDVVIMDHDSNNNNNIKAIEDIKEDQPKIKVIILIHEPEQDDIVKALLYGADGILHKEVQPDVLMDAIHTVYQGLTVFSAETTNLLKNYVYDLILDKKDLLSEALVKQGITLTKRELDVADLFRFGLSNKQIAHRLSLSEGTVKNYVSNIYHAINIHKRDKAITYLQDLLKYETIVNKRNVSLNMKNHLTCDQVSSSI